MMRYLTVLNKIIRHLTLLNTMMRYLTVFNKIMSIIGTIGIMILISNLFFINAIWLCPNLCVHLTNC